MQFDPVVRTYHPYPRAALRRCIDGRERQGDGSGHRIGGLHGDGAGHSRRDGVAKRVDTDKRQRGGKSRGVGRGFGIVLQHGVESHAAVVVEPHREAGRGERDQVERVFGKGERDGRGGGVDQPGDGLARCDPLVGVDVGGLDHPGEGGPDLRVFEQRERVLVGGLRLGVLRVGRFVLLHRDRLMGQQPLHALQLRRGLVIGRAVGIHRKPHLPRVELGDQRPLADVVALRYGHFEHLPGDFECQRHGVVGGRHAGEVPVERRGVGRDDDLHRADCVVRRFGVPAARGEQQQEERKSVHKKSRFSDLRKINFYTRPSVAGLTTEYRDNSS